MESHIKRLGTNNWGHQFLIKMEIQFASAILDNFKQLSLKFME